MQNPEKKQKLAEYILARDFVVCILVLLSLFFISTTLALVIAFIWSVSILSAASRSISHRN